MHVWRPTGRAGAGTAASAPVSVWLACSFWLGVGIRQQASSSKYSAAIISQQASGSKYMHSHEASRFKARAGGCQTPGLSQCHVHIISCPAAAQLLTRPPRIGWSPAGAWLDIICTHACHMCAGIWPSQPRLPAVPRPRLSSPRTWPLAAPAAAPPGKLKMANAGRKSNGMAPGPWAKLAASPTRPVGRVRASRAARPCALHANGDADDEAHALEGVGPG